jgi:alkane 1-monooxygenase
MVPISEPEKTMTKPNDFARLRNALPFWLSLTFLPMIAISISLGSWWLLIVPLYVWGMFAFLDQISSLNKDNNDPDTPDEHLFWYQVITLVWLPLQIIIVFGSIYAATHLDFSGWEMLALMFGVGTSSGTVGINYSHELMHQKNRLERWLGDGLLALVLYSHFRSEHLLVHHSYVGTPRDPVTARYNEGFHRFFPRVLIGCFRSAWRAEAAMLARKGLSTLHPANPFLRFFSLELLMLMLAWLVGGWIGVLLFATQAFVAVWQLELVNYVEHYGLTRKHLGNGKYEPVMPRHSWNSAHRFSNYILINLQRHSDHHYKPNRRFPLLQHHSEGEALQLPFGYPVMTAAAMIPPIWRRRMNPRVRKWRAMYYPEIVDWEPYKAGSNPMPKGAS